MKRYHLLGAAWMVLATACAVNPVAPEFRGIYGSWDLKLLVGGLAGTRQPATDALQYRFAQSGDLQIIRNDSVVERTKFSATKEPVLKFRSPVFGYTTRRFALVARDTLVLYSECCDRYDEIFVRIR